jgi:hypothetical protein
LRAVRAIVEHMQKEVPLPSMAMGGVSAFN